MNNIDILKALEVPSKKIDVVLDTDAYNEIDDQYAIAYMLKNSDKLNCLAIYAAPFYNDKSTGPKDGMEKSYDEIMKILSLCNREDMKDKVFKGSTSYLTSETEPVLSDAAYDLVKKANAHTKEDPLYVVAIGAITNVASAILLDKSIVDKIVIVWLGGHALDWPDNKEFNLYQDVAGARIVFGCKAPFVQLPCMGVVSAFAVSEPELQKWFIGKNELATYLAQNTINYERHYKKTDIWSKVIWDVTAIAWLLNENGKFMKERIIHAPIPEYDHRYSKSEDTHLMKYVFYIHRDALFADLIEKITN